MITTLNAGEIVLKQNYCIDNETTISSRFFDDNITNFKLIDIPTSLSSYDVPSLHIISPLKEHNVTITDTTKGIVTFQRNCDISGKKESIQEKIKDIYMKEYPCIQINNITVESKTNLPYNFKQSKLIGGGINDSRLRQDNGSIWTVFRTPDKKEKKIYFKYKIDAFITVFKAKHNMHNDKILSKNDYIVTKVKIDKLPSNLISCKINSNLITKSYIRAESLITYNRVEVKKDVLKGAHIRSFIVDGSLVIGVDTVLLEDANIGDKVRVKTKQNKFLKAKLFSENKAMILK